MRLDCYGVTDVGKKRPTNQDHFLIADLTKSMQVHQSNLGIEDDQVLRGRAQAQLMIVADGMGGHAGGERASQLAVETMARTLLDCLPWFLEESNDQAMFTENEERLKAALDRCQQRIEEEGGLIPKQREMGTTMTMAFLLWPVLYTLHVGDSRAYLLRDGHLHRLTEDQTVAEKLAQMGALDRKDVATSAFSHTLWSYLGVHKDKLTPDLARTTMQVGDTLLLCSDGLSRYIDGPVLQRILSQDATSEDLAHTLVNLALDAGGEDNITIIVARLLDPKATTTGQRVRISPPEADLDDTDIFFIEPQS